MEESAKSPEQAQMEEAFAGMLPDAPPVVIVQLAQMSLATKRVRVEGGCTSRGCPCKHMRYADVPDSSGAEKILRFVYEYGKGRPRAMEGDEQQGVVIRRYVKGIDDDAGS